ncbi:MAG TPA: hypothetical protein VGB77_12805 [Abditibacteriaceae bacterium]|jgi:hypothetical protein
MFSVKTTHNPTTHTVNAVNAELASEILEAALRADLYCEADESDARRIFIFFVDDELLDAVLIEGRNAYDNAPMMLMAA